MLAAKHSPPAAPRRAVAGLALAPQVVARIALWALAVAWLAGAPARADDPAAEPADPGEPAAERPRPGGPAEPARHLFFAVVDTLRRDHLGFYGQQAPTSPFLDQLADAGVVFEEVSSQASHTFPSTSSLFTSHYFPLFVANRGFVPHESWRPSRIEVVKPYPRLAEANLTLAEVLEQAGFHTIGIFTNPYHHGSSGFWQGFADARYIPPTGQGQSHAIASAVQRQLVASLDRAPPDRRLFVYVHFMDAHTPYKPPRRLAWRFAKARGKDRFVRHGIPEKKPSRKDLEYMRGLYAAEVRYVDRALQQMVDQLRERGLWGHTLFALAADHGEEFMEHGGLGHGTTLERELLRAPLLLAGRTGWPPSRVPGLVRNLDVAPTLLSRLRVPIPPAFQGRVLRPGAEPARHSYAAWKDWRSLTTSRWHLARNLATGALHLYDLRSDPDGLRNVADAHPEVVESLLRELDALAARAEAREGLARALEERGPEPLSPELEAQLEALGYAE